MDSHVSSSEHCILLPSHALDCIAPSPLHDALHEASCSKKNMTVYRGLTYSLLQQDTVVKSASLFSEYRYLTSEGGNSGRCLGNQFGANVVFKEGP